MNGTDGVGSGGGVGAVGIEAGSDATDGPDAYDALDEVFGAATRDPYPDLAVQRGKCPVHEGDIFDLLNPDGPRPFVRLPGERPRIVLGFEAANGVFRDAETFSSGPSSAPFFYEMMGPTMIQMDNPEHRRYRGLVAKAFTRRAMQTWEHDLARPIANRLIDAFAARGRGELVRELTLLFPTAVIGAMLGLPDDELPWLHTMGADIVRFDDVEVARRASVSMGDRFRELVEVRRSEPGDDVTGLLVAAMLDPDEAVWGDVVLSTEEIVSAMRQIFRAGVDTTYRAMGNMLFGLLSHPDQLDAVRADRALVPQAIEESLRWEPPLLVMGRVATKDTQVETEIIPAGAPVSVCIGAANRDERRYERPDEFDIFREALPHLAFSVGPHICLGIHLARMEMAVALESTLDRLPNVRLDPDGHDVHIRGVTHRSPNALPVLFDV